MNDNTKKILSETSEETKQKAREYGDFLAYNSNTIGIEKIFLIQENIKPILLFVNYKAMQGDWIAPRKILRKLVKDNLQLFTENGRIELHSFKFRSRSDIESFNNIMLNQETLEEALENRIRGINVNTEFKQHRMYSDQEIVALLDWLTNEKSQFSIMYGNQEKRFASNDKDYTIKEFLEIYKNRL